MWALRDLDFILSMVQDNHPGMYNTLDPDFVPLLERHYRDCYENLSRNTTDIERMQSIKVFGKSFNDGHVGVNYKELITATETQSAQTGSAQRQQINIRELASGIQWARIPTFMPQGEECSALEDLIEGMPTCQNARALVFDVRGNCGGNSMYGSRVVQALFGSDYALNKIRALRACEYVEWRASLENVEYLEQAIPAFESQFGKKSTETYWLQTVASNLRAACEQKKIYYREDSEKAEEGHSLSTHPVTTPIIVVMDQRCASATLDFIDYLKAINHPVTLWGKTTGADSVYMDVRSVQLPSNKGEFFFPIKVYRDRLRGHNIPHVPDVPYDGDLNDSDSVISKVVESIEL